jgi:RND family efflux transporter MFP subunit
MGLTTLTKGGYLQQGAAIATIDDRSKLRLEFVVSERAAGFLQPGIEVRASTPALPGMVFRGELSAMDSRIDAASRTLRVEATLPNPDNRLLSGMTFSVSIELEGQELPTVPALAIRWDRGGAFVWRLTRERTVQRVAVAIRRRENNAVSVEADLKGEDQVVIEGSQNLSEGAAVSLAAPGERPGSE